jgi:hypothetical protein
VAGWTIRVAGIVARGFRSAVASCAVIAASFTPASASARRAPVSSERMPASGVLIPSRPRGVLPFSGATVQSFNWSGYAVRSKSHAITSVTGTWVVPRVTNSPIGMASTWTGIGGLRKGSDDLIQAGTVQESEFFGRHYYAWYELLPNGVGHLHGCSGEPSCTVNKGDRIAVSIRRLASHRWRIAVADGGHWRWRKTVSYHSSRSSAEWILEAPSIGFGQPPLADVGTVHYRPTSKYATGSRSRTLGQGYPVRIVLIGQAGPATPSVLAHNGQSFNDCAYEKRCPRP